MFKILPVTDSNSIRGLADTNVSRAPSEWHAPGNTRGVALFDSLKPVSGAAYVIDLTHGGF